MKKVIIILVVIFTVSLAFSDYVEIGTGTYWSCYVPLPVYYSYSWCRTIYLQSEIGLGLSAITKIAYNIENNPADQTMWSLHIYMKHTSDANISSIEYEDTSTYTEVFWGGA